ncbi:chemotaxis protein CheW [Aliterella atlantica]|uniref:Chemotaxis protein CheW n=1 Tax=Aliterella atlantica CENA595 TaxID=1618023 RepID=A0A0D8ZRM0_9CYAN|nr:chemotaxis protein CheW [Aliterella atlantica]KJH71370.1 chemotaxis protein CheW [Aliterella atlantica CENA595]
MENKPYLIFSLHNLYYGIDALLVQEIFQLPELISVAEAPDDIVGMLNLRGKIVPVMHLDLRLGLPMQECQLTDSVIVLDCDGLQIGIIVNTVYEVKDVELQAIESDIDFGRVKHINSRFVAGIAKVDFDTIILANHHNLLRDVDTVEALIDAENREDLDRQIASSELPQKSSLITDFYKLCCPNATEKEKAIYRERAEHLKQVTENAELSGLLPLAVIGLNNEYFGLDLELVQEFTRVRNVTPIPCCPPHVVGNMNLRGDILTLVDIRSALNMPLAVTKNGTKALVVSMNDLVAGFPVDDVFDVMYIHPSEITNLPIAVPNTNDEYLRGTAPYSEKMLTIIDLPKLLKSSLLTVNEEI